MTWYRDEATLRAEVEKHGSVSAASRANGTPSPTVQRWALKYGVRSFHPLTPGHLRGADWPADPPPLVPIQDAELRLEGDFAVFSDAHFPLTRYDVLHRMLEEAREEGLTQAICAGDLTNQDALAGHEDKQRGAGMAPEMEHLHYGISAMLDVFDTVYISLGNHDRHLAQKSQVSFEKSIRMLLCELPPEKLSGLVVTARDYVIVDTDRGPWRICHTRSYSRLPLNYPNKLALRFGMHIAAGHRHHHAQGKSANGYDIVELGGFQDEERMAYVHRYTNDLPMMQNGYGLLVGGWMRCPMLFS